MNNPSSKQGQTHLPLLAVLGAQCPEIRWLWQSGESAVA